MELAKIRDANRPNMRCVKCQSLKLQEQNYYLKSVMQRKIREAILGCT